MAITASAVDVHARPPLTASCADTLRALAEASAQEPASAGLVARLNPGYPRPVTLRALEQLQETGLLTETAHPVTPLVSAYALNPAGRTWVRRYG
jgi:DNA-binding HxlR family transcriptional regulator